MPGGSNAGAEIAREQAATARRQRQSANEDAARATSRGDRGRAVRARSRGRGLTTFDEQGRKSQLGG